ncbi:MAG: STAS domain-containing protein [Planctomycetes bacterium]|nr:STAS domain-containing protein [Planctomycetota bacterium]
MLKRITEKIKKAWAEAAPPTSAAPRANPFARIVGRLNLRNAAQLRENLWSLLWQRRLDGAQRNKVVALDCSQVRFMDIGALAVLIEFAQTCRDTGVHLRLVEPSDQMHASFSMYGLSEVLVTLAEFNELDGLLVVMEDDFPDSIRLEAVAERDAAIPSSQAVDISSSRRVPTIVEEEDFPESIRIIAAPSFFPG